MEEEEEERQVGWTRSQTPLPPQGKLCPDSLCRRSSSLNKRTGCLLRSQSHCLMSSAVRCHGDHEGEADWRMNGHWSFPSQRRTAGHLSWSQPSGWGGLMLFDWRGAVSMMDRPKMEVCSRSSHLIGWRRSWRCCSGHHSLQMY